MTLRLRLTLLYGSVFIAAGAGLLAATYALFKHNQPQQTTEVVRGVTLKAPVRTNLAGKVSWSAAGAAGTASTVTPGPAAVRLLGGKPPKDAAGLIQAVQKLDQGQVDTVVRAANRRANVVLRRQRMGDASSLLEWSGIAFGVVALLSIGLAWWLAGRALRPLRTMNRRARAISAENLHERLGVDGRRDELGELATTFDALLARLEAAFDSQRRFVANASHELRTPITLERTLVEVALADPDASVDSLRRVCQRVVASTEQQERLLDALLTLARSEGGVAAGENVDLVALVEDALLLRAVPLQGIRVERELEPALIVGDQALLERLVANLLDNAIVHNHGDERWIRIATGERDGVPRLTVANSGEIVEPDRVDELFEPFHRGAGDRVGGSDGGLGLGLSIVRAVAAAHGARVEARALPAGGLEFELRFAAAPATAPSAKPPAGGEGDPDGMIGTPGSGRGYGAGSPPGRAGQINTTSIGFRNGRRPA